MSIIEILRTPRIEIVGMKIAVFDLSMTLIAGYIIGKKLEINPYLSSRAVRVRVRVEEI